MKTSDLSDLALTYARFFLWLLILFVLVYLGAFLGDNGAWAGAGLWLVLLGYRVRKWWLRETRDDAE